MGGLDPQMGGPDMAPHVVVTRQRGSVHDEELAGHERDTLVLTAEERRWGRRRVTTTGGRTLVLALPTGSTLAPGEVLHVGTDWYLVVLAPGMGARAAEPPLAGAVIVVDAGHGGQRYSKSYTGGTRGVASRLTESELNLRVAFEVGNRHFTLAIDGDRVLVPDDPAMDHLLTRLGVPFERLHAVFVPLGAGHRHDA